MNSRKSTYLLLGLIVFVLDQWTKWWVESNLELHRPREIIPNFLNLTHVENSGVAFGLFSGAESSLRTMALTAAGLLALGVVGFYYTRVDPRQRLLLAALSLVAGGAVGNLTDRVLSGSVTDFIDAYFRTYHWHTFNIADSAITIGVLFILLDSFRSDGEESLEPVDGVDASESAVGN